MNISAGIFTPQNAAQIRASMYQSGALPLLMGGTTVLRSVPLSGVVKGSLGQVEALESLIDLSGSRDSPTASAWDVEKGSSFALAREKLQGLVDRQTVSGSRKLMSEYYARHPDVDEFLRRLTVVHDAPLRDLLQKAWSKDDVGGMLDELSTEGEVRIHILEETAKRLYMSKMQGSMAALKSRDDIPAPDFDKDAEAFFNAGVLYAALDHPEAIDISQGQFNAAANRFGRAGSDDASAISRILAMVMSRKLGGPDSDLSLYAAAAASTLLGVDRDSYEEQSHEARLMYGLLCAGYRPHWNVVHAFLKGHLERGNRNSAIFNCHHLIRWVEFEQRYEEANSGKFDSTDRFGVSSKLLNGDDK